MGINVTYQEFQQVWNESRCLSDVCVSTGQTKAGAASMASKLRRQGWLLKKMPMPSVSQSERFFAKVQKTSQCWLWTGFRMKKGYGLMSRGRRGERPIQAHRLSYEIHIGEIPKGMRVLHSCDNPSCVNPEHLFLGTEMDNTHDMISKERGHWQKNAPHRAKAREAICGS